MKKNIFSLFFFSIFLFLPLKETIADEILQSDDGLIIPKEMTWTERFILGEQKELRIDLERIKREVMVEVQNRELSTIDRALSYSENTLNFFFIFLSIVLMGLGVIGWKSISGIKRTLKRNMENEIDKVMDGFQDKIIKIEQEQQRAVLWRNFYATDASSEKLDILEKIEKIALSLEFVNIEKTNVYLELEAFEKVIDLATDILNETPNIPSVLYNRGYALCSLERYEEAENDIKLLLQISSDYQEEIENDKIFEKLFSQTINLPKS